MKWISTRPLFSWSSRLESRFLPHCLLFVTKRKHLLLCCMRSQKNSDRKIRRWRRLLHALSLRRQRLANQARHGRILSRRDDLKIVEILSRRLTRRFLGADRATPARSL